MSQNRIKHAQTWVLAILATTMIVATVRAASYDIEQVGQKFSVRSESVKAGDTLVFSNHDDVTHNISVFDASDNETNLGLQKPGEVLNYKFDKQGRFRIRCTIHPSMRMTVDVS
jgi:plastocyanin